MSGTFQGTEFQVNTYTNDGQRTTPSATNPYAPRAIAGNSSGNFVVTWTSELQDDNTLGGGGIFAQLYSADGTPIGAEIAVNTQTIDDQSFSAAAMADNGEFVIVWRGRRDFFDLGGGTQGYNYGIYAQRFNADGTPLGTEIMVSSPTPFDDEGQPSVAIGADGGFVVSWTVSDDEIVAARFNNTGTKLDATDIVVNTSSTGIQQFSQIATDQNGNFVVVWASNHGGNYDIYAQRFNSSGVPQGNEFRVNTTTAFIQTTPSVSMDQNGNFVIAWASENQDTNQYGIYYKRFDSSGLALDTADRLANQVTVGTQRHPTVSYERDGDSFVISWFSDGEQVGTDLSSDANGSVVARRFNEFGTAQGDDLRVNSFTNGIQEFPSVTIDNESDFVAAWSTVKPATGNYDVYAQRVGRSSTGSPTDIDLAPVLTEDGLPALNENASIGTVVGTLSGTDAVTPSNGLTFTLVNNPIFDVDAFTIVGQELRLARDPDFETKPSYRIQVRATDTDGNFYDEIYEIRVINSPFDIAPTDIALTPGSVDENVTAGAIATLSATDAETNDAFTYSLVSGAGSTDNSLFQIQGDQLVILESPNFEAKAEYRIRVEVRDLGGNTYQEAIIIPVNDRYETPPTSISLSNNSIQENIAAGSLVATVTGEDLEVVNGIPDRLTFSLEPLFGDNDQFTLIDGELRIVNSPDYETQTVYNIRIVATDLGGNPLARDFTINVTDTPFELRPTNIDIATTSINENVGPNAVISAIVGEDPEIVVGDPNSDSLTFSLVPSFGDNAAFTITNGNLVLIANPDFETKSSYSIQIQATDRGNNTYTEDFTITVTDILSEVAPRDITLDRLTVDENVPANSVVAIITGTDDDPGDTLTYSLVAGPGDTDNTAFTVSGSQLLINASPNFEAKQTYSILLRVTDSSNRSYDENFTISVNNLFDVAPVDLDLDVTTVNENVPVGTVVGTISGVDPEEPQGDTLTFSLPNVTDNNFFSIVGNQLQIEEIPDFETRPEYVITIRATDRGGRVYDEVFTISVNNTLFESPPTNLTLDTLSVDENVLANTLISVIRADDLDLNDQLTYRLVAGDGDTDNAAFTVDGDRLLINASPDYETKQTYTIRLAVEDRGGNAISETFTITVNNRFDVAPTNLALGTTSINENVSGGTLVGNFTATDPEVPDDALTYTLVVGDGDTDNGSFTITNGQLFINNVPDFETKSTYNIRVQVTDRGGLTDVETFTITVNNQIDVAPTNLALDTTSIDENIGDNALVGTLSATDSEVAFGDTLTYTLIAGTGDDDNGSFTITNNQLFINNSPDFETKSSYSILVEVRDQNGLTDVETFTITVNDRFDSAPTDLALSPTSIDENVGVGTLVGTLTANDTELGIGDALTYSLVAGMGDTDNGRFTITNNQLFINAAPDYETQQSYSILVQVQDRGGLVDVETFTITVNDRFDAAPTDLALGTTSIDENIASGTLIGTLTANDAELVNGDQLTYSLVTGTGGIDNGRFTIVGNQLFINESPNFETQQNYSIRVQVQDQGNLTDVETFTIAVNNLIDVAPSNLALSATSIDENVANNTLVGTLTATDSEVAFGDTLTYSLIAGTGDTDNGRFTITNNQLFINASPDFETQASYSILVQVQDSGGLTDVETFTIAVNNRPEGTPPNDIALSFNRIDENVNPGTVVGTLSATDPDGTTTFTFSLINAPGYDTSAFTIVGNELRMAVRPDYETKSLYRIRVQVLDAGGSTYAEDLTIFVNDLAENRVPTDIILTATAIAENSPAGSTIGSLITSDPDIGDTFTYSLVDGVGLDTASFTITGNTLAINSSPDFETKSSYRIRIRSTDAGGLSREELFTITVLDRQETSPPSSLSLSNASIAENVAAGSVVGTLATVDPDPGETFTYTLVSGTGDTDNAAFRIVGNQVQIIASPDFETKSNYSVRVQVTDRQGNSIAESFAIAIVDLQDGAANNLAPVLDVNGPETGINFSAPFTPGLPVEVIAKTATLTDADSTNLVSAAVVIANPLNTPDEILSVNVSGTTIRAEYLSSTGVLTLTGNASLASYLNVLKTVTYNNTITVPGDAPRTLVFVLDDGVNTNREARTQLIPSFTNTIQATTDHDPSLVTTPQTDLLTALAGNDTVTSTLANLQQDDRLDGDVGIDTLQITDGTGNLLIDANNLLNQVIGLAPQTRISNFENFNLEGFQGTVQMTGTNERGELLAAGAGNDTLSGLGGDDSLSGGAGNDTLDGGTGNDTMIGGSGNDVYIVDSPLDFISEGEDAGIDTVQVNFSYSLAPNLENLDLLGQAKNGRGNGQANALTGNGRGNRLVGFGGSDVLAGQAGADILVGGAGNDLLVGSNGRDLLIGGGGRDTFLLSAAASARRDRIRDFRSAPDLMQISLRSLETLIPGNVPNTLKRGTLKANQFTLGSVALNRRHRFLYDRPSGNLYFDPDGSGAIAPTLLVQLENRATINHTDIAITR